MGLWRRHGGRRGSGSVQRSRTPRLSVVVPVFNVEEYLPECLGSLLEQTYRDLEVVIVDDGSTDRSGEIAQRYARRQPHVRVVTTDNHGLGAARNTGVQHARGELLAFADSDDTVLPEAYAAMVEVLDGSGSDFVVGALKRALGDRVFLPAWQRNLHDRRRLHATVDDRPEMLADVFAVNKVFRRSFWERADLSFPQGVLYEDQVALTRAYLTSKSFDVIRRPVYVWRTRSDRSSITQRRQELVDLRDRLRTKSESLALVRELASDAVQRTFLLHVLTMDLPRYFRHIPACDDQYWTMLMTGIRDLYDGGDSLAQTTLPVHHRLAAWLVLQGRRADAETVLSFAEQWQPNLPLGWQDGHMVAQIPFWDDPSAGIPPELFRLQEGEQAAVGVAGHYVPPR